MKKTNLDPSTEQRFSSRWGFILSALGIAIGTSNIWRLGKWWLALAGRVEEWYNPFKAFSLMSCLVQWSLIIGILLLLNKYLQWQTPSKKP
jgi:hypothetical protein